MLSLVVACASPVSFTDQAGAVMASVLVVQQTATTLTAQKTITVEQDKKIQAQLDLVVAGVKAAVAANAKGDTATATAKLGQAKQLAADAQNMTKEK